MTLAEEERQTWGAMVTAGKSAARKLARARALLLAEPAEGDPAKSDPEIVKTLDSGRATVEHIRKQFVTEGPEETLQPKPAARVDELRLDDKAEAHFRDTRL